MTFMDDSAYETWIYAMKINTILEQFFQILHDRTFNTQFDVETKILKPEILTSQ